MISSLTERYWRRVLVATAVPAASLGVFRWIVGLFQLLVYVPDFDWIDDVPHGLFDPPEFSVAYLAGGFPPAPFFTVIDIIAVAALLAMTIGWHTRASTLVVVGARLVGTSFAYSFGKIDHTDVMLTWLLLALAFSSWGEHFTLVGALRGTDAASPGEGEEDRETRPTPSRSLAVFATLLVFGMFTAGLVKLRGWVDFDLSTSGVLRWFYPNRDMLGRDRLLARFVPGTPAVILEMSDYLAVLMELSAVFFLLLGRRTWLAYLAVLTGFHLANVLILNIAFSGQVITYSVFVGVCLPHHLGGRKWVISASIVAALAATWNIVRRLFGDGAVTILLGDRGAQTDYLLYIALFVCLGVLVALVNGLRVSRTTSSRV